MLRGVAQVIEIGIFNLYQENVHFCPPEDPLVNCRRKHLEPKRKVASDMASSMRAEVSFSAVFKVKRTCI